MEQLLLFVLPSEILDYFELSYHCEFCTIKTKESGIIFHLEEKNILPVGFDKSEYESKGFYDSAIIQDFPLRGKQVFFSIRKRRWRHKTNKFQLISRDFSFIADGTRMTADLSAFLKGTGRNASRYDLEYL
jgi:hypothetical protein